MGDKIMNENVDGKLSKQEKVLSLFRFLQELNKLKQKVVLRVSDYPWWRSLASLPDDPENIKIYYRDRTEDEEAEDTANNVLLSVRKREFQDCPKPDPDLEKWLEKGWSDFRQAVKRKEFIDFPLDQIKLPKQLSEDERQRINEANHTYRERFADDPERATAYETWIAKRDKWAESQKMLKQTRDLFTDLYNICTDLERDAETLELVVADGFIRDRLLPELDHPILTRRVKIRCDAKENIITSKMRMWKQNSIQLCFKACRGSI